MRQFLKDENGIEEMPLKIVAYVILTAVIVAIVSIGLYNTEAPMAESSVEKRIGEISASLEVLNQGAARNILEASSSDGGMRTVSINLPASVEYVSFGIDPESNASESSAILYKVRGSAKRRFPLSDGIALREGEKNGERWGIGSEGLVLRGGANYEFAFEAVYDGVAGKRYIISHYNDSE
jgi:hypothetical protein